MISSARPGRSSLAMAIIATISVTVSGWSNALGGATWMQRQLVRPNSASATSPNRSPPHAVHGNCTLSRKSSGSNAVSGSQIGKGCGGNGPPYPPPYPPPDPPPDPPPETPPDPPPDLALSFVRLSSTFRACIRPVCRPRLTARYIERPVAP